MRSVLLLLLLTSGCALSHGVDGDAGARSPDAGGCSGSFFCYTSCDTGALGVCVDGAWVCPAGSSATPPSECCSPLEPPPRPGCRCAWVWMCPPVGDFACGPSLTCSGESQFCAILPSDVPGDPTLYSCLPLPAGCTAPASCSACFPGQPTCRDDGAGAITLTSPAG